MPSPKDIYIHCDELEHLPPMCRKNWEEEIALLAKTLKQRATVLQVGCMDGTRILALFQARPDLQISGLDIDQPLLEKARENFQKANVTVALHHRDITDGNLQKALGTFDDMLCLNNTLGYISDISGALKNMKRLGKRVIVSVYGEKFTDELAREYFSSIGLHLEGVKNNMFSLKDFVPVKRFTREEVQKWAQEIRETPLGYFCIL